MPYYMYVKVNSTYRRVFTLMNETFGNVTFEESITSDSKLYGIIINQVWDEDTKSFVIRFFFLMERNESRTDIKIIALEGNEKSLFRRECLERYINSVIDFLKNSKLEPIILEKIPYFKREIED
ncbi:MAG: hypothetical protein ACTSVW_07460 [Candidatus Njordarchaeales archaeon]